MALAPLDVAFRDVNAAGVRTRALTAGHPAKPPVVLIHDFLVSHLEFEDILPELAASFHVVALDLPGFGESEKPTPTRYPYTIEALAEAVVDVIAALSLGRAAILGHGLGGAVALTVAAEHPELAMKLVLVDALCYPPPRKIAPQLSHFPVIGGVFFKQFYSRSMFRRYYRDLVLGPKAIANLERIDRHYALLSSPNARESAHATIRAMFETRPTVARLGRVRVPTLVVWGHDDQLLPVQHGQRLAHEVPDAQLRILDTGHSPHEEQPALFSEHVKLFLQDRR